MRAKRVIGATATVAGIGAIGAAVGTALLVRKLLQPGRDFEGKVVVITGGSRGLGLAMAHEFGKRGARIAIGARNQQELDSACAQLQKAKIECFAHVCDVSERESVQDFLATVRRNVGKIDVLVNNAGVIQVGPFANQQIEDFEQAMAVNFWGAVYASYEVLPEMLERGSGKIVNISSVGGKVAVPHLLPYSASKFALTGFSEGLRAELSGSGVAVTTVCPGLMRTGSQFQAEFKGQHEKEFAWFLLSSSTPFTSISAKRAASQIANATKRGQAELIISWQAELLARVHGAFPGLVIEAMGLVNRVLPSGAGDSGNRKKKGRDSESAATRNPISAPSRWAARKLNERNA